ncbi:MAG: DUF551 domain-containing protein [Prevotellaceae bacterium]|jgi:hypothetical protein|nr:DUF551 domain-containing protein [Prevotellaceae bacterium]
MKTIKEAAHEYFRAGQLGFKPAADTEAAFIAGVEFAQQWISVDKELPEVGQIVLVSDKDKDVLIDKLCEDGTWLLHDFEDVTHWRPIELKMKDYE